MTAESDTMTEQDVTKRLKSISKYVQDCIFRVSKGEIMDLQGLDNNVIEICDAVADLPPQEARALEDQMSLLIQGLEDLASEMRKQQDVIEKNEGQS